MSISKRTIILFSGWLHNFNNETEFINELKKDFNIVTIKYPGYYKTEELNNLPNKFDLSDYVYLQIKELNLKNCYLLGFSMGCQVILHTVKKYKLKDKIILISPTTKDLMDEVPFLLKPFVKNRTIFKFIRGNRYLANIVVNMAYKKISQVTENGKADKNSFNNENISTTGAFDTLYFLVTNFIDPKEYLKQIYFIFGDREILQNNMKANQYYIIKNCGHGEFNKKYKEFVKIIKNLVSH